MKHFNLIIIWTFGFSLSCLAQTDCVELQAVNRLFKHKKYCFKVKQCTTMKFEDGIVYHVPEIIGFTNDSIKIVNRGIYADKVDHEISYSINSIVWINWDGIPRKKIRSKFYVFEITSCNES